MQTMNADQEQEAPDNGIHFVIDTRPIQDAEQALKFCQALAQLLG